MNLSETAFIRKLHPTDNFTQSKYAFLKTILRWYQNCFSGGGMIFKGGNADLCETKRGED